MNQLTLTSLCTVEKLSIVAKNAIPHLRHGKLCMNTRSKIIHTNATKLTIWLESSLQGYLRLKIQFPLIYQGIPR